MTYDPPQTVNSTHPELAVTQCPNVAPAPGWTCPPDKSAICTMLSVLHQSVNSAEGRAEDLASVRECD